MMPRLRPFFPYYGSKWNTARYYPPPAYGHLVEPFAGSAGYALFYGQRQVTLVDLDPIIVGVWDYLLRVTAAEILALPELPEVGDNVDNYQLPQEARWLIGFWLNRGSAQPKKSRTAYSARTDKRQLNWGRTAKERIASQLFALESWRVREGQYFEAPEEPATWFIDPPYGEKGRHYRYAITCVDYHRLARWSRERSGQVIVCENVGAIWLPFTPLGSFKSTRGRSEEAIYTQHWEATNGR
jgi:site-specific DNA-adenine methylase